MYDAGDVFNSQLPTLLTYISNSTLCWRSHSTPYSFITSRSASRLASPQCFPLHPQTQRRLPPQVMDPTSKLHKYYSRPTVALTVGYCQPSPLQVGRSHPCRHLPCHGPQLKFALNCHAIRPLISVNPLAAPRILLSMGRGF